MADYTCNRTTGSDTNDGSDGNPVQHVEVALLMADTAGDRVLIDASDPSEPYQENYASKNAGTAPLPIQVIGDGGVAYINNGALIIDGGSYEDASTRTYFQSWSGGNPSGWTASGATEDNINQWFGAACAYMGTAVNFLRETQNLPQDARFRVHVLYKNAGAGRVSVRVRDNTAGINANLTNGTWVGGGDFTLPDTAGTNAEYISEWVDAYQTAVVVLGMQLTILNAVTGDTWVQGYWCELESVWSVHSGSVYSLPLAGADSFYTYGKMALSDWNTSGMAAMRSYSTISSATVSDAAYQAGVKDGTVGYEGMLAYVHADRKLYYFLDTGESIASLVFLAPNVSGAALAISHDYQQLENITCVGGSIGLNITGGAGVKLYNVSSMHNKTPSMSVSGSANVTHVGGEIAWSVAARASGYGEGLLPVGTSTYNGQGIKFHHIFDDPIQPYEACNFTLTGFLAIANDNLPAPHQQHTSVTVVEPAITTGGSFTIRNGTLIMEASDADDNSEGVIVDKNGADIDSIYDNIICIQNGNGKAMRVDTARTTGSVTCTNVKLWGSGAYSTVVSGAGAPVTGFEELDVKLTYNSEDVTASLDYDSPCLGVGTKWWTGARPIGADGEPFSNTPDIGGIMSKFGPFHPKRL